MSSMKQVLRVGLIVGFVALGIQSQAEAVVVMHVLMCQGITCTDLGTANGPGTFSNDDIPVGDFLVSGSVKTIQNANGSNAATTTISVQRVSNANAAQGDNLDIWLNASGYMLPVGPEYLFQGTLSGTSSLPTEVVPISMQAWVDFANGTAVNPAVGLTAGMIGCNLPTGAPLNCSAPSTALSVTGGVPFSMTMQTRYTITDVSATASYTTNAQANIVNNNVPEPASMLLLGTGLMGVARFRRRKNQATR
jgi:hypothetical protein